MTAAAPAAGRGGQLRAYWELGKPRLSALAVFAVVAGAYMAWPGRTQNPHPPFDLLVLTTLGTFLAAVGANALNMYRERDLDLLMVRTQGRPLPTGRLSPAQARGFGVGTAAVGLLLVLFGAAPLEADGARHAGTANPVAALVCAAIVVSYVLVYTPMKVRTPLNTLVGAVPGALPPVVGHAAVTGQLAMPQLVLFAILFCWQVPHFLSIAWRYRDDYARAGMRMLPVVDPTGHRTGLTMLLYGAGLGIASCLPFLLGLAGERYVVIAVLLNALFFVPTLFAALTRKDRAMRLTFVASITYLPLLFLAMVWDRR
ncbi:MAG: protoheme IX farnesyltransferase [Planctomycetes bacterium]|nr:protoheme IX farnesyltransferase [Planctomycetota bacterium]